MRNVFILMILSVILLNIMPMTALGNGINLIDEENIKITTNPTIKKSVKPTGSAVDFADSTTIANGDWVTYKLEFTNSTNVVMPVYLTDSVDGVSRHINFYTNEECVTIYSADILTKPTSGNEYYIIHVSANSTLILYYQIQIIADNDYPITVTNVAVIYDEDDNEYNHDDAEVTATPYGIALNKEITESDYTYVPPAIPTQSNQPSNSAMNDEPVLESANTNDSSLIPILITFCISLLGFGFNIKKNYKVII